MISCSLRFIAGLCPILLFIIRHAHYGHTEVDAQHVQAECAEETPARESISVRGPSGDWKRMYKVMRDAPSCVKVS